MTETLGPVPEQEKKPKRVQRSFPTLGEGERPAAVDNFVQILPGLYNAYIESVSDVNLDYFRSNRQALRTLNQTKRYFKIHNPELLQNVSDLDLIDNLLGVDSPSEAIEALNDESKLDQLRGHANAEIAKIFMFKEGRKAGKIADFGKAADRFIGSYLRHGILEPFANRIDIAEEVKSTNDVVDLMRLMLDPQNDKRVRFEAKRKLVLMQLAAQLDKSRREEEELNQKRTKKDAETESDPFVSFLEEHVWSQNYGKGASKDTVLLSRHSSDTYECTRVEEVDEEEAKRKLANHNPKRSGYYYRLTHLPQRIMDYNGEEIPVAFESRPEKDFLSSIGKLFRKGEQDPTTSIEDMKGWWFVVRNRQDAIRLKRKIEAAGRDSKDGLVKILKTEDSTQGAGFSAEHPGSSTLLEVVKLDLMVKGSRLETLIFTYDELLNYKYRDELAHEDFEIRRMVKNGVIEGLFPEEIYGINENELNRLLDYQKQARRNTTFF